MSRQRIARKWANEGRVMLPAVTPRNDALPWCDWLPAYAPGYVGAGFAPRHVDFWDWAWSVEAGQRPAPFIAIWPRGGGKSTSCELMTAALLLRGQRRYALYVSGTQDMADRHVEAIGAILERLGVARSVNRYGASRGWRRNRLRAADGFTVDAFGLDTGSRGVKDDEARPDLIIFDDLDQIHDSPATTRKKIETLTMTVLPTATDYAAIVGVQNLIHAHSIFAQLADGRADFLTDRRLSGPHPALRECVITRCLDSDGQPRYDVAGVPTWQGQDLPACQRLITTIGPEAFRRESQHEVGAGRLAIYPTVPTRARFAIPADWPRFVGMDFGGVHTCAVFIATNPATGVRYVYREYLAGERTAAAHAAELKRGEPAELSGCGGARSEEQWRREFARGGLRIAPPPFADVEVGIDRVAGALGDGSLVIFDDLAGLLGDLRDYQRLPDAQGRPTGEIRDKSRYHYADALRYAMARLSSGGARYMGVR